MYCTSTAATGWISVKFDIWFFRENLLIYVSYPKQLTLRVFFRSLNILFRFPWSWHHVVACMITIIREKLACLILQLELLMEAVDFFICPYPEMNSVHATSF